MGPDELFEATAQAMLSAIDRDASSGYGVVIYTITKVGGLFHFSNDRYWI